MTTAAISTTAIPPMINWVRFDLCVRPAGGRDRLSALGRRCRLPLVLGSA